MAILEQSPLYRELIERGEQRGEQRGIKRGIDLAKREVALNLLRMGIAIAQVSEATGLSVEQLAQLRNESSGSE